MRHAAHLARRFFGSLAARPLSTDELTWVRSQLSPTEWDLWQELSRADCRHSLTVAREVEHRLHDTVYLDDSRWLAAALLHDVGKVESGLGTMSRVVATLLAAGFGRARAERWSSRRGPLGRVGRYLRHPELGAVRVNEVSGRPEITTWAAVHHRPDAATGITWDVTLGTQVTTITVPFEVAAALNAADDD